MKRNLLAAAVPALTHLGLLQVKRNLVGAFVPLLQHLGLLIAFVLLIAGHEFATKHPVLATVLVFVFSLPYLIVSVTTRRASFLYATMLLGAVSYFLACHALGVFVSTAVLLFVGTRFHRQKEYDWSRHFYFSAAGTMFVSLALSLVRWPYVMVDLALTSLLLWVAYGWLSEAVDGAQHATLPERVVAKYLFIVSLLLVVLIVPWLFLGTPSLHIACTALICGLTFSWVAWQRRTQISGWTSTYVLAASRELPGWHGQVWPIVGSLALLGLLGVLYALAGKAKQQMNRTSMAGAAVFPSPKDHFWPLRAHDGHQKSWE